MKINCVPVSTLPNKSHPHAGMARFFSGWLGGGLRKTLYFQARKVTAVLFHVAKLANCPEGARFSQPWATPRGRGRGVAVVGPTGQPFALEERLARWADAWIVVARPPGRCPRCYTQVGRPKCRAILPFRPFSLAQAFTPGNVKHHRDFCFPLSPFRGADRPIGSNPPISAP